MAADLVPGFLVTVAGDVCTCTWRWRSAVRSTETRETEREASIFVLMSPAACTKSSFAERLEEVCCLKEEGVIKNLAGSSSFSELVCPGRRCVRRDTGTAKVNPELARGRRTRIEEVQRSQAAPSTMVFTAYGSALSVGADLDKLVRSHITHIKKHEPLSLVESSPDRINASLLFIPGRTSPRLASPTRSSSACRHGR